MTFTNLLRLKLQHTLLQMMQDGFEKSDSVLRSTAPREAYWGPQGALEMLGGTRLAGTSMGGVENLRSGTSLWQNIISIWQCEFVRPCTTIVLRWAQARVVRGRERGEHREACITVVCMWRPLSLRASSQIGWNLCSCGRIEESHSLALLRFLVSPVLCTSRASLEMCNGSFLLQAPAWQVATWARDNGDCCSHATSWCHCVLFRDRTQFSGRAANMTCCRQLLESRCHCSVPLLVFSGRATNMTCCQQLLESRCHCSVPFCSSNRNTICDIGARESSLLVSFLFASSTRMRDCKWVRDSGHCCSRAISWRHCMLVRDRTTFSLGLVFSGCAARLSLCQQLLESRCH